MFGLARFILIERARRAFNFASPDRRGPFGVDASKEAPATLDLTNGCEYPQVGTTQHAALLDALGVLFRNWRPEYVLPKGGANLT